MGDDTMSILFFGTYDVRSHPRVAVLRDGLRAHGAQVEECNAPLGLSTADRVSLLRKPWTLPLLAWRLASCWTSLARGSKPWRRPGHRPDAVVVGYLGHFDVLLARRLFRGVPIVLDHLIGASSTAADRGVDGGLRQRLLRSLDAAALASADLVVVDTDEHLQALPEAHRGRAITVLVGAPATWSAAGGTHDHTTANPLRVVFFGLFTPLQGAPTIGAAIGALAQHDIEFTMIGTGQDLDATRQAAAANPHVRWIDWVDADALPAEVAAHDVCLGIFGTTPKALKVVPNKVYQGAAAGCAVVTSDTDPQRRVLGDAAMLVPAGDAVALADALARLADDRVACRAARDAARTLAADSFTPMKVTDNLYRRLDAQMHGTSTGTSTGSVALPPLSPNGWLRWEIVHRHLPKGNLDVLEVGCGQGGFGARLAQRYRYLGIEPDDQSFSLAAQRVNAQGGQVRHGDHTVLAADEQFDLILSFEVIEHIDDDVAEMAAWVEHLRPGGRVLLSTPAWQHRYGNADEMVGHCRRYDPSDLKDKLERAGFVDVEVIHFGAPLGYVLESARNIISGRRLQHETTPVAASTATAAERSSASGRMLQPSKSATAVLSRLGTYPFRKLQLLFPGVGPGIIAIGHTPD